MHGLIDRYGNELIPFLFDQFYHFGNYTPGMVVAVYNGRHGVVDEAFFKNVKLCNIKGCRVKKSIS